MNKNATKHSSVFFSNQRDLEEDTSLLHHSAWFERLEGGTGRAVNSDWCIGGPGRPRWGSRVQSRKQEFKLDALSLQTCDLEGT